MDLGFIGLIDIILIISGIFAVVYGYKKGFMKKAISLMGGLVIIGVSYMYCGEFAHFLTHNDIIYPEVYENIHNNIIEEIHAEYGADVVIEELSLSEVMSNALGLPGFISDLIVDGIGNPTPEEMVSSIASEMADIIMCIISFFIMVISIFIICLIAKLFASIMRTNSFIRFVDGTFGSLLYLILEMIAVCIVFAIISCFMDMEWFSGVRDFLVKDMQLNNDEFRLSKLIYEHNMIVKIFKIIF